MSEAPKVDKFGRKQEWDYLIETQIESPKQQNTSIKEAVWLQGESALSWISQSENVVHILI